MKILGIDPGSVRIGYGLIEEKSGLALLDYGVLEIQSRESKSRIQELSKEFKKLIARLSPDIAGVETLYFAKNQKTALSVAESRGILMLTLLEQGIPVTEFRPGDVKLAVANHALADKIAVATMVQKILAVPKLTGYDDASDALAIAITAAQTHRFNERMTPHITRK